VEKFPGRLNGANDAATFSGAVVLKLSMRLVLAILTLALAACGSTTKAAARRQAQEAFMAGQRTAVLQQQSNGVTVIGPVRNPNVPWVAGLTLAQAIATANYLDYHDPKEIIITRQGETATVDPKSLINGVTTTLEPGDVIEIR
jgi:hypothetical protein